MNALDAVPITAPCRRYAALLRGPLPAVRLWLLRVDTGELSSVQCGNLPTARAIQRVAVQAGSDSWLEVWRVG
jgi:hypothetical protein